MEKNNTNANKNTAPIIIGVIILAAVLGGVYLLFTNQLPETAEEEIPQETEQQVPEEIRSLAGRVTSVNVVDNSFVVFQQAENRSFTVRPGENTQLVRLGFPFDITNPPPGASFTPTREEVTLEDLQVGEQVFVRTSVPVSTGGEVIDPLQVQILP